MLWVTSLSCVIIYLCFCFGYFWCWHICEMCVCIHTYRYVWLFLVYIGYCIVLLATTFFTSINNHYSCHQLIFYNLSGFLLIKLYLVITVDSCCWTFPLCLLFSTFLLMGCFSMYWLSLILIYWSGALVTFSALHSFSICISFMSTHWFFVVVYV